MRLRSRLPAIATILTFSFGALAAAGTIDLAWDPVDGATGYRIYFGTSSGQYSWAVDVGSTTQATLQNLEDCTDYYASVKAYNQYGESAEFSNEVSGWARPTIGAQSAFAIQGSQAVLDVYGANFDSAAQVVFSSDTVPTDQEGAPLVAFDSISVLACDHIQALLTVEPTAMGFQAAPVGELPLALDVQNPDGVYNTGSVTLDIAFNESRADVNRLYERTVDRVDGDDLATFARSWASNLGQDEFEFDCDMDGDTDVDGDDLALLASVFGLCRSGQEWSEDACL
jgi:hypothetical protein